MTGNGSQNAQGMFLLKIDALGNMSWAKYYAGQEAHGVKQTSDKGYILLGDAHLGLPNYQGDVVLVKTDSTGTIQWSKGYGGTGDEQGLVLELANDGGFVAGGTTLSFGTGLYIIKTDTNGNSGCNETNPVIATSVAPFIMANAATQVTRGANTVTYPFLFTRGATITSLCSTVGIDNIKRISDVKLFPNPTNNFVTVQYPSDLGLISIYNSLGEIIYNAVSKATEQQIDLTKYSPGIYFLSVQGKYLRLIKE